LLDSLLQEILFIKTKMLSGAKIFITGSSRGLGVEMVKQLCERSNPPSMILASCRSPATAGRLQGAELQVQYH